VAEHDGRLARGNPGVGRTFLSEIIGWRICQANQRVLFTNDWNTPPGSAQPGHTTADYGRPTTLVLKW
jgi:hypothetical protein